jgi:hypothetical protein
MVEPNGPRRHQSHATSQVESAAVAVPTKTELADVKMTDPETKTEILVAETVSVTVTMIMSGIAVIAYATPIVSAAVMTATRIEVLIVIETVETVPEIVKETANAPAATDPHLSMAATTQMLDASSATRTAIAASRMGLRPRKSPRKTLTLLSGRRATRSAYSVNSSIVRRPNLAAAVIAGRTVWSEVVASITSMRMSSSDSAFLPFSHTKIIGMASRTVFFLTFLHVIFLGFELAHQ